jgi:hypothetical protein
LLQRHGGLDRRFEVLGVVEESTANGVDGFFQQTVLVLQMAVPLLEPTDALPEIVHNRVVRLHWMNPASSSTPTTPIVPQRQGEEREKEGLDEPCVVIDPNHADCTAAAG